MTTKKETMWKCEIGISADIKLPFGSDMPMRRAIAKAFREITGREPDFLFSGWGEELTEQQRKIVAQNGPGIDQAYFVGFDMHNHGERQGGLVYCKDCGEVHECKNGI